MNPDLEFKIESYLSGRMSEDDAEAFTRQIEADPELKAEVELYAQINHHLAENLSEGEVPDNEYTRSLRSFFQSEEAKQLEATLRKVQSEYKSDNPGGGSGPQRRFLLVAAIAILLVVSAVAIRYLPGAGETDLYAAYYDKEDIPSVITRDETEGNLQKGANAYFNEDYSEALTYFDQYISEEDFVDPSVYIYTGLANLELGNTEIAIAEFDKMIESGSIDSSKGLWFKALAYVRNENIPAAKSVLEQITKSESNFNYDKAKDLLDDL